jgi:hypothetical protein
MDTILEIYDLIPKQENDFQITRVIDQVCKVLDKNDLDFSYKE